MATPRIEALLADVPLFAGLSPRELAALARRCVLVPVLRGAALATAGAPAPGLLLLVSGAVRLSLHGGEREERVLRLVGPGETFCLASAVLDRPSPYQATALAASEAVIVPSAGVRALLEHDAPFARRLIEALAARELELCAEIHAAAFHSSAQRLAAYLNGLAQSSTAGTVELPCSKTLIAARLGMKKETLSRLLKRFAGGGLIGVSRSRIAILDRERLAAAASAGAAVRFDPGQAGGAALRSTERQGGLI